MKNLNFLHLRSFWITAKTGSLRAASERWHISQPALSEQIKQLEQALETSLFCKVKGRLVLTDAGRRTYDYAEEIFSLGRELTDSLQTRPSSRALSVAVGVADSLPKLLAWSFMRRALQLPEPVRLLCREGKAADLLEQLTAYRLDIVLCDEPAPSHLAVPVFSQAVAQSGVTFLATAQLAEKIRRNFPASLADAPLVMPSRGTAMRATLDKWLAQENLTPQIMVECDDSAMLTAAARDGIGIVPVPTIEAEEVCQRYDLQSIGAAGECLLTYQAITAVRKSAHPAVAAIMQRAFRAREKLTLLSSGCSFGNHAPRTSKTPRHLG